MLAGLVLAAALLDPRPTPLDYGLLAAAELALAADISTTLDIKNHRWGEESNPILGKHPSDQRVLLYGAACGAGIAALWLVLPNPYRSYLSVAVLSVESHAVYMNLRGGLTFQMPW